MRIISVSSLFRAVASCCAMMFFLSLASLRAESASSSDAVASMQDGEGQANDLSSEMTEMRVEGKPTESKEDDPFEVTKDVVGKTVAPVEHYDGNTLNLEDLIEIAILNNPDLRQSYLQARIMAAQHGRSLSLYLPNVNASGSIGRTGTNMGEDTRRYSTAAGADLSLDWLLYDFGARGAISEKTKQTLIAANYAYNAALRNLVFSVVNTYFSLLSAQSMVESSKANVESAKMAYDAAAKRLEIGTASLGDKLQAETAFVEAELSVTSAENNLEMIRGDLALLLNYAPQENFTLRPTNYGLDDAYFEGQVEDLMRSAVEERPEVVSKRAELKASEAELQSIEKEDNLRISLNGSVGVDDGISPNSDHLYNGTIGLKVTIPLFTGFDHTYSVLQSRYRYENARISLSQTENDVRVDVWKAYQRYKTAKKAYEINLRLFASAEQNEKVAMGAYKQNKGNIINLLNAQSRLMEARRQRSSALYDLLIAKSDLLRALGRVGHLK